MRNISFVLVLLFTATSVLAQEKFAIEVTVKDTVPEQYQLAKAIVRQAATANNHSEKIRLTATAIETLEVIPRRWPSEHAWLVAAGIVESDLFAGINDPADALRILLRVEPITKPGSPDAALVLLRIGKLNAELRRDSTALQYLTRADAAAPGMDAHFQFGVDLALSGIYSRNGNWIEAAKRFRRLAAADRLHDHSRVSFLIQGARLWLAAGRPDEAGDDLDRADNLLRKTKSTAHDENEASQQKLLERSAKQLRDKLKKH